MRPLRFAGFNGATGFRRWKLEVSRAARVVAAASMGPPAFAGGNRWQPAVHARRTARFNGATGFRRWKLLGWLAPDGELCWLQWGHRRKPVETIPRPHKRVGDGVRFNGATGFRRWKRARATRSKACGKSFNGATGFRRWKPEEAKAEAKAKAASMGPPAFAGGNLIDYICWYPLRRRFNGATGFRRWKPVTAISRYSELGKASMGPPAFAGGNS